MEAKTKEDLLLDVESYSPWGDIRTGEGDVYTEKVVEKLMDDWAKECLMGFKKFCDDCTCHWEMGNEDFKNWDKLSQEQVIELYIQSKNKLP